MSNPRMSRAVSAAMTLGLGLALPASAWSQVNPNNANLSTGSGAGTSPGVSPGSSPSSTRIGNTNLRPGEDQPGGGGFPSSPGGSPLIDLSSGMPVALDPDAVANLSQEELDEIDSRLLADARAIVRPDDRAQAFERVARSKIYAHRPGDTKLEDAQTAITEGGEAAVAVRDPLTRDLRLMNLLRTELLLADEWARDGMVDTSYSLGLNTRNPWTPQRRLEWLSRAENSRNQAADLASRIESSNLRSDMMFRVVDNQSQGSQYIAQEASLTGDGEKRSDLKGLEAMIDRMADRGLVFAANNAARITKPIWRDRAMVSIAIASSASGQFDRGIQLSRTIPQPEYRSDALIRLAEGQARRNLDGATFTYDLAARAVASIPLEDPRAILASVLIDSLIAVGRFDDARACVPFYSDSVRQLAALGAIAESQGERRLANSALAWIDRDAPPQLRDQLKLRVNDGVLRAFEKGRANRNQGDIFNPR